MQKKLMVLCCVILMMVVLGSACNLPVNSAPTPVIGPTLVAVPTKPVKTGSTIIYQDLSTLVFDEGGPVQMGDGSTKNVDPFWMYQSAVTDSQYALCVAAGACTPPDPQVNTDHGKSGNAGLPVDGVSLDQAQAYCTWMGGSLPTEAQFRVVVSPVQLPPGPCAGTSKCAPPSGQTFEMVLNAAGTDAGGYEIPLPPAGIILQNSIILQGERRILNLPPVPPISPVGAQAPTLVPPTQVSPTQVSPTQVLPTQVSPTQVSPTQVSPTQVSPTQVSPTTVPSEGGPLNLVPINTGTTTKGLHFHCIIPNPVAHAPMCTLTRVLNSDFPSMVCPVPEVSIAIKGQFCTGQQPYFSVDINNADKYDVGLVSNAGSPNAQVQEKLQNCTVVKSESTKEKTRLVCTGDPNSTLTVYAQEYCSAPANSSAANPCLDGYEFDASSNMCVYKNTQSAASACPSGFTLSPLGCCAAAKDYPAVCPAGYIPVGNLGCAPYSNYTHTVHQDASLPSCSVGTGNGGSGCVNSCPTGYHVYNCTCQADKP